MNLYDKLFSCCEMLKNKSDLCFEILCFEQNTPTKSFILKEAQSLSGSCHADKLLVVILAI